MSNDEGKPQGPAGTVFQPSKAVPRRAASTPKAAAPAGAEPVAAPAKPKRSRPAPAKAAPGRVGGLSIGTVLNNSYEVRRFIARGGMGEVYEGVNVASDERVAIKIILSHLASDEQVQAAFKREARTLTQLSHPALVQYRGLAYEPNLQVYYIVTEFIDGDPLADLLGQVTPSPAEIRALTRRLAAGLAVAHEVGVFHRDMAPDNVLLPHGRLDRAKIIDFGIAKDSEAKGTIIGDGFAGKLGFVAPEQFGEYGGHIGPYSDIYSLGLVILAVAQGRPVDMGATLADALGKRKTVPDLGSLPDSLRPIFQRMLEPDPTRRFQSMEDVMSALDGMVLPDHPPGPKPSDGAKKPTKPPKVAPPKVPPPRPPVSGGGPPTTPDLKAKSAPVTALDRLLDSGPFRGLPRPAVLASLAGLGAVILIMTVIAVASMLIPSGKGERPVAAADAPTAPAAAPAEAIRKAVEAALPGIGCSWVDVDAVTAGEVSVSGAAAGGGAAVNAALSEALTKGGLNGVAINTDNVFRTQPQSCGTLDALRALRIERPNSERLVTTEQARYEIGTGVPGCEHRDAEGKLSAKPVIALRAPGEFAVLQVFDKGEVGLMYGSRASALRGKPVFVEIGAGEYQLSTCTSESGISAFVVLEGGDLGRLRDLGLGEHFKGTLDGVTPEVAAKLKALAGQNGWKAQMAWYEVVDEVPNLK